MEDVTAAVRAWVDGAEGRQMPSGLPRVRERLRKARELTAPMRTQEARDFQTAVVNARPKRCQRARARGDEPEPVALSHYFGPFEPIGIGAPGYRH